MSTPGSERINYLLDAFSAKHASAGEEAELFQWIATTNDAGPLKDYLFQLISDERLMVDAASDEPLIAGAAALDSEGMMVRIQDRIRQFNPPIAHRIHFLKATWVRYAAVVILILGAAAYLWTATRKTERSVASSNKRMSTDIAAGTNKALLTLANGKQILLDSTQGNILQQEGLTVANIAGKLNYEGLATHVEYHVLSTPKGGQYRLLLPDGSKVWLNAASSITYPTAFIGNNRTVTITGEVYFEVMNDKSKIFKVKTPKEEITVLGTHFNVNAYSDEAISKTSLLEGVIKINNIILQPGQAYMNGKIIATNVEQDIAWKNGVFNFDGVDLHAVMRQLERWYDITVEYRGNINNEIFKGQLSRDLTLTQITRILEEMNIKFIIDGKKLIVTQ